MTSPEPGRIKLSVAALELGCHVETLRERVRAGLLDVERGPHGAYYVTAEALLRMPPIERSSQPRRLTPEEVDASWEAAERLVGMSSRTREAELTLLRSLRADPSRSRRLYRLITVQALDGAGLTFAEIALELGITARHVRRLAARSLSIALRKEIYKQTDRTTNRRWRCLPQAIRESSPTRSLSDGYAGEPQAGLCVQGIDGG
jgi:hypothetical protein